MKMKLASPWKWMLMGVLGILAAVLVNGAAAPSASAQGSFTESPIPLTDFSPGQTYLGFEGGLYPGSSNQMPAGHFQAGSERAGLIQPLNTLGQPDPDGKIIFLSIGMSNTNQEFCGTRRGPCNAWTFMGQALQDPSVRRDPLVMINGARPGQIAEVWSVPEAQNYDLIRDQKLQPIGLSESQVQVVWLKVTRSHPEGPLPAPDADAYQFARVLGNVVRSLKNRYPNLQQVFLSSRIYGGYAVTTLSPEPYAYENGFSIKWLIEAQIEQMAADGGLIDPLFGDLNYDTVAPWLSWGPYLWADGLNPRSDGLVWDRADFEEDGVHPSRSGEEKVGRALLDFFKNAPHASCWFLTGSTCASVAPPASTPVPEASPADPTPVSTSLAVKGTVCFSRKSTTANRMNAYCTR
jgi:hypothetical protein